MLMCHRVGNIACLLFSAGVVATTSRTWATIALRTSAIINQHLLHTKHNTSQERLHAMGRIELVSSFLFLTVDLLPCFITASPPPFILQTLHFSPIWWHYLDRASLGPSFKYKLHKAAQCLSPIPCPLSADAIPEPAMSLETLARSIAHHQRARTTLGPTQVFSAC